MQANKINLFTLKRSHSYSFFDENRDQVQHDSFFNDKRKGEYESELAEIFLRHVSLFMPLIKKISSLMLPDIMKLSEELLTGKPSPLSSKMHQFLINDFDLKNFFDVREENFDGFYNELIRTLQDESPDAFYKHMCLQYAYITFFTRGNVKKPELEEAVAEQWCEILNLNKFISDMNAYRDDIVLFENYQRLPRSYLATKESRNIGILPPEAYLDASNKKIVNLKDKLFTHKAGKLLFFVTTACNTSAEGMYVYDMPQLCGPSGTTAKRLALASQANLNKDEMQLIQFAISLFNVAIGAHTIDECYIIAGKSDFNHYCRGNYRSIIPDVIDRQEMMMDLKEEINSLNDKYSDILISRTTGIKSFNYRKQLIKRLDP